jgi:hypothetical protein
MLVKYVIQGVLNQPFEHEKDGYTIIKEQDNHALKIFFDLINNYGTQYSKEIYDAINFALLKSGSINESTPVEIVYQLIEVVLILAIKETPKVREVYMVITIKRLVNR